MQGAEVLCVGGVGVLHKEGLAPRVSEDSDHFQAFLVALNRRLVPTLVIGIAGHAPAAFRVHHLHSDVRRDQKFYIDDAQKLEVRQVTIHVLAKTDG